MTTGQIAMTLALAEKENLFDRISIGGRGKRGGQNELARKAGIPQPRIK
jgi:hypothetical protein